MEGANLIQMTILSTTVGKNPLEGHSRHREKKRYG